VPPRYRILALSREGWRGHNQRSRIVEALKNLGTEAALEAIVSLLDNAAQHQDVRCDAARALGELGDTRVMRALEAAALTDQGEVSYCAKKAISKIKGNARTQLMGLRSYEPLDDSRIAALGQILGRGDQALQDEKSLEEAFPHPAASFLEKHS
jgi:hypothetical protein